MHPYIVETMAREQLNDRLAEAADARRAARGVRGTRAHSLRFWIHAGPH